MASEPGAAGAAGAALVPVREELVTFDADQIVGAQLADGQWVISLRPVCAHLGVSWQGQWERTRHDPVLGAAVVYVKLTLTETGTRARGAWAMVCLPLDHFHGWLFGITRVQPAYQDKLNEYRRRCFRVLWAHFKGDVLPASPPDAGAGLSPAQQTLDLINAIQHMAQQQVEIEQRLATIGSQQTVMADWMRGFVFDTRDRLTALELHLSAGATISEVQAGELAGAVKTVAAAFAAAGTANGYQRVYSELYRRYGISGYKSLPAARYGEAMAWLQSWYQELAPAPRPPDGA